MSHVLPRRARRRHSVTVVIPCYRYGHYLPAATAAAFAQRAVDVRIIIVDDASPDDSLAVARALASADDRIRVIAHERNQGHIATYNDGFAAVDTEFVTLVSADDLVAPGGLDRAVALMERHPRVGLVYGKVARFQTEPELSRWAGEGLWRIWRGCDWVERIAQTGFNPVISPEAVLRTDVLRRIGGYEPSLPHAGDLEYWLRIATGHDVGQIRGVVQAHYREHGANMHLTSFGDIENLRQKALAFQVLGREPYRTRAPWAPGLLRTAMQTLAAEARAAADDAGARGESALARAYAAMTQEYAAASRGAADRPTEEVKDGELA